MSQIVKLRRSSVSGQKPTNSNLQLGELALNTTDGKVYMAKSGSLGPSVEELISTNAVNTGSVNISGSLSLIGNETITGSLYIASSSLPEIRLSNINYNQNYHITVGNAGYLNVHDGLGNYVALFGTSSASLIGDLYVSHSVTASHFTGAFVGDATNLTNVPFHISGSDISGNTLDKTFTKLQFDDSTGLNVEEINPGTAFISIGSHFKDIFVSGSPLLSATGSDAFEIIPTGGVEITTSITDTNANGYVKELTISTTNLSSSINDRIDIITGSIDGLNSFTSSVVLTSQTGSMSVLSASYAVTAAFALNAGGSGGTALGSYSSLVITAAASTWSFQHDTGQQYPIFQVFDDNGYVVIPSQIQTIDNNNANIIFPTPQTGRVIASLGGGNGTTKEFINSNLWTVDHNLGTDYPDVTVWDSNRNIIIPNRVESVDDNQIKIYFSVPVTGHVSVSRGGHILSGSAATISGLISGSSQITNLGFATTGSNTFVGSQTITGCLTVNNAKLCSTGLTISSNTEIFNLSSFDGAFFDYVVKNGTNMRAGSIMSAWNGTNATFNETTTMDLGTTNAIGFNVSGTGRLNATVSSGTWLVEVLYRALGSGLPQPTATPVPTATATPGPTPTPTLTPNPTATSSPSYISYYRSQTTIPNTEKVKVWARFDNGAWINWMDNYTLSSAYQAIGPQAPYYGSQVAWCFTKAGTETPISFGVNNGGSFTGYCGFNNPYIVALNNQPNQPFYFNIETSANALVECVSVQPTATPTPTPSATPSVTNYSISSGSTAPDYCSGLFGSDQTVYGDSSDWLTITRFYTDSGMTTPFNGASKYYGNSTADYGTTLQINSSGYVIDSYAC